MGAAVRNIREIRTKASIDDGIIMRESHGDVELMVYEPGNGTRYTLVFSRLIDHEECGTVGWQDCSTIVTLWPGTIRSAAMVVADEPGNMLHWRYVAEKLRLGFPDAVAVAEILGHHLGRSFVSALEAE